MRVPLLLSTFILLVQGWSLGIYPSGERLLNQRTGDNFLVVCKVKEYEGAASDVKVDWYKDGNLISRFGSVMTINKPYSNQLMINRPKISDCGKYVCKAEVMGEEREVETEISFIEPPKFVDAETEQHPEEGSRAQIKCKVEGTDELEVFWQFNDATLDESSPRGYDFEDSRQTLVVPNYNSKKDDGIYSCNAAQFSSFETLNINVTGFSRPIITVFDVPDQNRGYEGQSAQLRCGAIGKPAPTYKWFKVDGELIVNSDKHSVENGLLTIESLSSEDAGSYNCQAENPIGDDTKTAQLEVFLKPRIEKMIDFTKKEGEMLEIICRYSGEGTMKAKFVADGKEFSVQDETEEVEEEEEDEEELKDSTAVEDNADLSVEESNFEETDVTSDIMETTTANSAEAEESDEKVEEDHIEKSAEQTTTAGSEEEFEDEEENEENLRWRRFVSDVNSRRFSVRQEGNSLILAIHDLSIEDAGPYSCVVNNEAGENNRTSTLAITHAPEHRASSEPEMRSFDGNTVTIFCDVSAVPPPMWSWTRNGDEVDGDGHSVIILNDASSTKLTLHNKEGSNYGNYTCKANNGIGTFQKTINVIKVVPPSMPEDMDCKKLMYPNYGKCSFGEDAYLDASTRPTEIDFYVATLDEMNSDFHWENADIVKVEYDEDGMKIHNLRPNTQYMIRAKAVNEAGSSEMSDPVNMETTEPWVPTKPVDVHMLCEETCVIKWEEPNDHGSDIIAYRVTVQQMKDNDETNEREPVGSAFIVELSTEDTSLNVGHIRPHSIYSLSVAAINAVGRGPESTVEVETDENPTSFAEGWSTTNLLIVVGVVLLFLLLVVDLICYSANRCGFIACLCLNCCGRNPRDSKAKDVEAGRGESNRLLEKETSNTR